MDLKRYYEKVREVESSINDAFVVVASLETPDGGKAGILSEVPSRVAARMVVDGTGKLASKPQVQQFREAQAQAQRAAEEAATANRVQLTVLPLAELNRLRETGSLPRE
ncbi:MAG TPA: hypothetical protein VKT49_19775 [Bryobacteraceae bacterium]|nr:hypothetical protein [Bryobacteraceae bacterium]